MADLPDHVPPPTRLRILHGLTEVLRRIDPANGYGVKLDNVYRGILNYGDEERGTTFLSIIEPPAPPEQQPLLEDGSTDLYGDWDIVVQGFCPEDPLNPSDPAQYLLADIKACLARHRRECRIKDDLPYFGMPNVVLDIQIGAGTVRPPDDLSISAYCYLLLRLRVVEDIANPYAPTTGD